MMRRGVEMSSVWRLQFSVQECFHHIFQLRERRVNLNSMRYIELVLELQIKLMEFRINCSTKRLLDAFQVKGMFNKEYGLLKKELLQLKFEHCEYELGGVQSSVRCYIYSSYTYKNYFPNKYYPKHSQNNKTVICNSSINGKWHYHRIEQTST